MKHIAKNKHGILEWYQASGWVFVFGIIISLIGLSSFKNLDEHLTEIFPKGPWNNVLSVICGALVLAFIWALVTAGCVWVFGKLLAWHRIRGWPRYYFYAFKFSDGKPIVGWMRLALDGTNGMVDADGESFEADTQWTLQDYAKESLGKCVHWDSEIVGGGTFNGHPTCYILYQLNASEADQANRPYRDGFLRFRQLRETDLKANAKFPRACRPGADQYLGRQQATDQERQSIYNLAYAESVSVDAGTDKEIEQEISSELVAVMPRLLSALEQLRDSLEEKI